MPKYKQFTYSNWLYTYKWVGKAAKAGAVNLGYIYSSLSRYSGIKTEILLCETYGG